MQSFIVDETLDERQFTFYYVTSMQHILAVRYSGRNEDRKTIVIKVFNVLSLLQLPSTPSILFFLC
jgi:hypothetical protein